jgi:serine-type D-Ala-D-Ala endopeptidase (penicillin-binding protein 7)
MATLVLILPLFTGLYFLYSQDSKPKAPVTVQEVVTPISINLKDVQTTAYSAFVVSLNTHDILYQKNPDTLLPLASLTKLVTTKVAHDQLKDEKITINKLQEFAEYGDTRLHEGSKWNAQDLIDYTLVTSSNDGAHSLSSASATDSTTFTKNMNALTASIGLVNTHFYNETGLDNDTTGVPGSKGTAQDMTKILSYLVKNDLQVYEKTKHAQITVSSPEGTYLAKNTDEITNKITGLLVSKTGYTDLAGGNLAIVADMGLNEPVAFVVLKSSKESRFADILKLQNEYFAQVRKNMQ